MGVTAQAVSRWESGGGYPDIGLIPAIANYFHISIDSLFGYYSDREKGINEYLMQGNSLLLEPEGKVVECIRIMKKALEEFPDEPKLQMCLAHALSIKGGEEVEKPNMYLEEAVDLYKKLSIYDRNAIRSLVGLYSLMEDFDKAVEVASDQPDVSLSREVLLASVSKCKEQEKYRGEAILSLLHSLMIVIGEAIASNDKLVQSREGLEICQAVRNLYAVVIGEKNCGRFHSDFCLLDLSCTGIEIELKEYEIAKCFFNSAYYHYSEWIEFRKKGFIEDDNFDTPLLTAAGQNNINLVWLKADYIKRILARFPEELQKDIVSDDMMIAIDTALE